MKREKALEKYYLAPNRCKNCGKIIEVRDSENPADARKRKFCSSSCAATFNNKLYPKRVKVKRVKRRELIKDKTLGYYIKDHKYLTSRLTSIRLDAKKTLLKSGVEKTCTYCKKHEFDDIVEVHHLKGILEFDSSTKISEINNPSNLVWLCPNHHIMLERGMIQL